MTRRSGARSHQRRRYSAPPRLSFSPPTPRFPPGFSTPWGACQSLVPALFPQMALADSDLESPVRQPASSGSSCVPDSLPEDPPEVTAPSASGHIRKVWFATAEDLLRAAPLSLIHGAPRPCLKTAPPPAFIAAQPKMRLSAPSSPMLLHAPPCVPVEMDSSLEPEWQVVKALYWWRAKAPTHQHSRRRIAPSFSPPTGRTFVKHRRRTCHKCLEKGHCKVDCRDPYKCLICRRSGHRARQCSSFPSPSSHDCR